MRFRIHTSGFTIIEAVIALSIAAVGLAGIMMLNASAIRLVRSSRMSNAATLAIQERVEQLRISNWRNITDATFVRDTFFAAAPRSAAPLHTLTETLKLSAYPDPTANSILIVKRTPTAKLLISGGTGISEETLVRVDLTMEWLGEDGRRRVRESSTILSKVGVSRLNLAFAGSAGGGTPTPTPSATATPSQSATPSPTASPTPSASPTATPAPTTTPDPTPDEDTSGNNGNGNGRGNVNGKGGKK